MTMGDQDAIQFAHQICVERAHAFGSLQLLAEGRVRHDAIDALIRQGQVEGVPAHEAGRPEPVQISSGRSQSDRINISRKYLWLTASLQETAAPPIFP